MRYWVFKHGAKDWGADIVKKAYKNNYCYCQFEYRIENSDEEKESFQDTGAVTKNWKFLQEVKVGDVIILSRSDFKFAWGYVIKPRFSNPNLEKKVVNCNKIIQEKYNELRSDNYYGYVEFEDCECFYENLEDGAGEWGQRIDVKKWNDYKKDGIYYPTSSNYKYNTIQEISKEDALNIVRALKNDPNFQFKEDTMEDYKKLLESNYNLILTGAPGTGKTYLAKQIAAKIIFDDDNKEYTEALEKDDNFKNQCEFVQFHPSYDYTDFVEGLRPVNNNGSIVFERKDGVFKEFCKRALKNLTDSKKEDLELVKDAIIKKYLITFANEIYDEFNKNNELILNGMRNKPVAPYIDIYFNEEEEILLMTAKKTPQSKNEYTINGKMDQYVEWYKIYKEKKENGTLTTANMEKTVGFSGRVTYLCAFLHNFDIKYDSEIKEELKNSSTNTVEKVQKKNFVFIIDEINRGEISKIFGELFFAVDPGYRGIKGKALTQYSNLIDAEAEKYFYIPENVYIIGTMNDIDRSVESMDFAMRRRFAWKEVKAENTQYMLNTMFDNNNEITEEDKQSFIDEAKKRMNALNNAISAIESFNSSYHIGASYFLKLKNYYDGGNIEEAFTSLWENHLRGLLYEYLRGMPDAESKLEELKSAYNSGCDDNTQSTSNTSQDSDNSNGNKQNDIN
ncbi:AAA family ATPase [Brachyspira pulli]|uniref:McrB family protein n=1 Tax=Brachyspira pulli TaxID=310721 RepID=UPI0030044A50